VPRREGETSVFDQHITIVGNLVAEPRISYVRDGVPVASFRIASNRRRFDRSTGEWRDGDTLYATVTCWRGLAENVAASLRKGQSVIVTGRLSVRDYETKDGDKRQSVEIDAVAVGADLSRVVVFTKRTERTQLSERPSATAEAAPEMDAEVTEMPTEVSIEMDDEMDDDLGAPDEEGDGEGELVGAGVGRLRARLGMG
jgi:single-strand DNA-binding protein